LITRSPDGCCGEVLHAKIHVAARTKADGATRAAAVVFRIAST
jgi:hypothetical protein